MQAEWARLDWCDKGMDWRDKRERRFCKDQSFAVPVVWPARARRSPCRPSRAVRGVERRVAHRNKLRSEKNFRAANAKTSRTLASFATPRLPALHWRSLFGSGRAFGFSVGRLPAGRFAPGRCPEPPAFRYSGKKFVYPIDYGAIKVGRFHIGSMRVRLSDAALLLLNSLNRNPSQSSMIAYAFAIAESSRASPTQLIRLITKMSKRQK